MRDQRLNEKTEGIEAIPGPLEPGDAGSGYVRLVPTPPDPPGDLNYLTVNPDALPSWTLPAGQYAYTRMSLYYGASLDVQGSLFMESVGDAGVIRSGIYGEIKSIHNSGLILGRGLGPGPNYVEIFNEFKDLDNEGQIFAVSENAGARALLVSDSRSTIVNSGLIAAYAAVTEAPMNIASHATAIDSLNGGSIRNLAGGEILAEGYSAAAIYIEGFSIDYAHAVENDGRIEARSLPGGIPSLGIYMEYGTIVNTGLIKADIALAMAGTIENSGTVEGAIALEGIDFMTLHNLAGGVMRGAILGGTQADIVDNAGLIAGDVYLDDGNDRFTQTGDGWMTGIVDLGFGEDVYSGWAGLDRVAGDNGKDQIDGAGGNDLLFGGNDDDRLVGGAGNDGLYGERGDDVILTSGADHADGGLNDDRIELGDYAFAFAGGGGDTDTLVLAEGARTLDLGLALASHRLAGFEIVEMRAGQTLVVAAADVAALADDGAQLRIDAAASDTVDLVGAWTVSGNETVNGAGYVRYALDGKSVLVAASASVQILAASPAGAQGLDAVAGGDPALEPGQASGIDFTPDQLEISGYRLVAPTQVYAGETWFTTDQYPIVYGESVLTNRGTLSAINSDGAWVRALDLTTMGILVNEGTLIARSTGAVANPFPYYFPVILEGAYGLLGGSLVNHGNVDVYSLNGTASALGQLSAQREAIDQPYRFNSDFSSGGNLDNSGTISVLAEHGFAVGDASTVNFHNTGQFTVTGAVGSLGIFAGGSIVNAGVLEARIVGGHSGLVDGTYYEATAITIGLADTDIVNSGRISGDVAIRMDDRLYAPSTVTIHNSGTIEGLVTTGVMGDSIDNSGLMTANVSLGAGDDRFDGSLGSQLGLVDGGDGNDSLIGGAGDDRLMGGAGADQLDGGGGADLFVYTGIGQSTASAQDRIRGFVSGIDRIDLTGVGPVEISWTSQTDASDGSAFSLVKVTNAAGEMSIRVDGAVALSDFLYSDAGTALHGTAGNDEMGGGGSDDMFFLQQGGDDRVLGGGGSDGFYFGATLNGQDWVDGGPGTDTLALQGDYYNYFGELLWGVRNVEVVDLMSGTDTSLGDSGGHAYSYRVYTIDATVAAGAVLTIVATDLKPNEHLEFYGGSETDGSFRIFAGQSVDQLTGGAGSDGFFFGADGNLTDYDRIEGGAGNDSLALRGNYVGAGAITGIYFTGIENLVFLSGHTNEYGGPLSATGFDYDFTMSNVNVPGGQQLNVIATTLGADESLRLDGRFETNGSFRILSGAGDDTLYGGYGDDVIWGALGADTLDGGAGADTYLYRSVAESTAASQDNIIFGAGDRIDLSAIDAIADGGNDAFAFVGANAFSHTAGELRAVDGGGGHWLVEADVNGDGLADFSLAVTSAVPLAAGDFVL